MSIEEGFEEELPYIEFRQLFEKSNLRIPDDELPILKGRPGPSLLTCSNRHGLLFFPLRSGFGWAKLSSLAIGESLEHGRFDLDSEDTNVIALGTESLDRWLVVGNGKSLNIFDLDLFSANPDTYEPKRVELEEPLVQVVFGPKILALVGHKVFVLYCDSGELESIGQEAKSLCFDRTNDMYVLVQLDNSSLILNSDMEVKHSISLPEDLQGQEIKSIICTGPYQLAVIVEPIDKSKPYLDIYHVTPDGTWTQFFDPTRPRKKAPSTLFTAQLSGWDEDLSQIIFVANAVSADIGAMGRLEKDSPFCTFFLTTEEYLAQLPISTKDSRSDQFPIGIALDFTNPELTPSGKPDTPSFPASPVLWILTNEGFFTAYRIIKSNSRTQYHEMNLNPQEFPNILKRRSNRLPLSSTQKEAEQKTETESKTAEQSIPIDFSTISSGFIVEDFGKYTNALVQELLLIQETVKTDLTQIRETIGENSDLIVDGRRERLRNISRIEKATLKLAQECDNPSFLQLFKIEHDIHNMAVDVGTGLAKGQSLKNYTSKLASYTNTVKECHSKMVRTAEDLAAKMKTMELTRKNVSESSKSIEEAAISANKVKEDLSILEQNLSLLKLSNTNAKASSKPKLDSSKLTAFAARLAKRRASDCLHVCKIEEASAPSSEIISSASTHRESVDPRFYQCVFPIYNEEDFAYESEDSLSEESEEEIGLVGAGEVYSEPDEFDFEEVEPFQLTKEEELDNQEEAPIVSDEDSKVEIVKADEQVLEETVEITKSETELEGEKKIGDEASTDNLDYVKETEIDSAESPTEIKEPEHATEPLNEDSKPEPVEETVEVVAEIKSTEEDAPGATELVDETKTTDESRTEITGQIVNTVSETTTDGHIENEENEKTSEAVVETNEPLSANVRTEVVEEESKAADTEPSSEKAQLETIPEQSKETSESLKSFTQEAEKIEPQEDTSMEEQQQQQERSDEAMNEMSDVGPEDKNQQNSEMKDAEIEPSSFGFMSISKDPKASNVARSIFGVPESLSSSTAPAPSSFSTAAPFGSGPTLKAPSLGAFAPKPEESIFGKSAGSSFGSSGFGGFGQTASSSFGQSQAFGQSSAFGQQSFGSSTFGSTTPSFGSSTAPSFGSTTAPSFGSTTAPTFGSSTAPSFGSTTVPAFGSTSVPTFGSPSLGSSTSTSNTFGSTSTFGASTSTPAFGSSSFGAASAPAFGSTTTPSFGSSGFGQSSFAAVSPSTTGKVFGQNSTVPAATPGFGVIASAAPTVFGADPNAQASQQDTKKNLPSSFTQFRG